MGFYDTYMCGPTNRPFCQCNRFANHNQEIFPMNLLGYCTKSAFFNAFIKKIPGFCVPKMTIRSVTQSMHKEWAWHISEITSCWEHVCMEALIWKQLKNFSDYTIFLTNITTKISQQLENMALLPAFFDQVLS